MLVQRPDLKQPDARTLFQEDWWLQAASGGTIERIEVKWDQRVVGSLSFMRHRRRGWTTIGMPAYTRTLGPVITPPPSNVTQYMMNTRRITRELVKKLPSHDRFFQLLDPDSSAPFGFSLAGCVVGGEFTFRTGQTDLSQLFANIDPATRRLIKAKSRFLRLEAHLDLDRFWTLAAREHAAGEGRHDADIVRALFTACAARSQTIILSAVNEAGIDVASVILVWANDVAYYWVPARDRIHSGGGGNAFLVWNALRYAVERGMMFDFDGYASIGTARFLSSFGVPPCLRTSVTHRSLKGMACDGVRTAIRRLTIRSNERGTTNRHHSIYRPDRLE